MQKSGMQYMLEQMLGSFGIEPEKVRDSFAFVQTTLPNIVTEINARFQAIQRDQQTILAEQAEIKGMLFDISRQMRESQGDILPAAHELVTTTRLNAEEFNNGVSNGSTRTNPGN